MVLVVSELVLGTSPEILEGDDWDKRPFQEIIDAGRKLVESLPSRISIRYVIGTKELSRFPHEDVHVVDGVKCYLPKDMLTIIGKRTIVLDDHELRFEPRLEPYEIDR